MHELLRAVTARASVERATGALMHLHGCTPQQAHTALEEISACTAVTLPQAASIVLATLRGPSAAGG